ncbi:fatty acid synthase [Tribolium castaneum]|uniref:oleoyl-[acyl-carrier-protein] hydrolase n=1 Tax=Tribolium castaneum TaxID=7070 RepID=D2A4M7_TRICA|nr:Fatty acid synthase-like Protein [Tribolium castaneum]
MNRYDFEYGKWLSSAPPDEQVVISGISGKFPKCENVTEFLENLEEKKDMLTESKERFKVDHPELPLKAGLLQGIDKFDAGFFGIHHRQIQTLYLGLRKLLEITTEAIMDAGIHPEELKGSKTGVFVGYSWNDSEVEVLAKVTEPQQFAMTGLLRSMVAHRLSYFFKLKGPSHICETACSSSLVALDHALKALRSDQCENAIVATCHLTFHPAVTVQFFRLGVLSPDSKCKVFDQEANGYVRSEAMSCLFLQKSKNARRIYAKILHSKENSDGFKSGGITFPSSPIQGQLLKEMYAESGINPNELSYFEAHGTATRVGDVEEVNAIDTILAQNRTEPLYIGSVKSNIGHSEPGSGLSSLIKVILCMHSGYLLPNINYNRVKQNITGIVDGRLKVVTEKTPLHSPNAIAGVSSFGFGGSNCHVIVQRWGEDVAQTDGMPRLVCVSGRTEMAVWGFLNELKSKHFDVEFVALVHHVFKHEFSEHPFRGFVVLGEKGPLSESVRPCPLEKVPLFVKFGPMDKSYQTVGRYFLKFPVFEQTIRRIGTLLGNDQIIETLKGYKNQVKDPTLLSSYVQLGIIDVLKVLKIDAKLILDGSKAKLISQYYQNSSLETILERIKSQETSNGFERLDVVPKHSLVCDFTDSGPFGTNPEQFLEFLGRLYLNNYNPQIWQLYPQVKFPVRRTTPFLSPLIKWNHETKWPIPECKIQAEKLTVSVVFNLEEEADKYIEGHVIDGRNLFPATGYLYLIWVIYAENHLTRSAKLAPVVFTNCKFIRATIVPKIGFLNLVVSIQRESGFFEIMENDTIVVTGRIQAPQDLKPFKSTFKVVENQSEVVLDQYDIYKELHLRGYDYTGLFKNLVKCNTEATCGVLKWDNNWVAFMDTMLQIKILQMDTRDLYVPVGINKLVIDPIEHLRIIDQVGQVVPINAYKNNNLIKSGGIEISGLYASPISKRKQILEPVLEKYVFVPNSGTMDLSTITRVNTQIILENTMEELFKAVEIVDEVVPETLLMPLIYNALEDVPVVHPNLIISTKHVLEEVPGVKIENYSLTNESNLSLIVGTKILSRSTVLQKVLTSLSKTGYILSREDVNFSPITNVVTVTTYSTTSGEKLVLCKKLEPVKSHNFVKISSDNFNWVQEIQKLPHDNLVLYSEYPCDGTLGLINCLRREPGGGRIICVFMMDKAPVFDSLDPIYSQQIAKNLAVSVYKNGTWGTYRHLRLEDSLEVLREHSFVTCGSRGDLSTLRWVQGPLTVNSDLDLVISNYCAINFKDIMTASARITVTLDRINQENIEGIEFSGRKNSQNVMGIISNGALSTLIASDPNLTWVVPPHWSLEDAATVPVVYATVIYALLMRSSLNAGTSILIHSGTGGVGLAAINVALAHKCTVFVTVGTKEKRDFLKKNFPEINERHIGNSRDVSFKEMILKETRGRGVDVVLNSLSEEKLKTSVQCLARGGKFMEIGKFDLVNNNSLQLLLLEKEASYHGIMLDTLFKETKERKTGLWLKVDEGLKKGYIKPLPRTVFESNKVETAFRYMMSGTHIGKVLLKVRDESTDKPKLIKAYPKFYCDPKKCYIVIGGLGGFGLELTDWLVLRGARNLVLTSRTGVQTGYQTQRIKIWQSYGARVNISTITISSKDDCVKLIQEATKLAPVDAIFNLAVVLKDELFENQTEENFRISLTPKAFATKYLDQVSRDLCPNLRFFVVFSSVSCGRGNIGQSNYGMANSIMERVCEKRKSEGFPALAIQWGAIGDVGLVAKMQKDNKELVIGGTLQQKISSCLNVMDRFLNQDNPVVSSMVVAEKRDKRLGSGSAVDVVATILGIKDLKTISHHSTLAELGMDSMMSTEVMQILEKDFEIFISAKEIRNLTFTRLKEMGKNSPNQDQNKQKLSQGTKTLIKFIPENCDETLVTIPSLGTTTSKSLIFVFPGIEGVLKLLDPLTTNLKSRLLGVQYSYKNPESTIRETAIKILPLIERQLTAKNFNFVGYSFGALVALELAQLLEEKGFVGKIVALDGSPHYTKQSIQHYAPGESEAETETMLLYNILGTVLPLDLLEKSKTDLIKCSNFDERINRAVSLIPEDLAEKHKLEKQAAVTLHQRFKAVRCYTFGGEKIKSFVKLYKAEVPLVGGMDDDYKLAQLCDNKVEVMTVGGDHTTMLEQGELANDLNKIFEE